MVGMFLKTHNILDTNVILPTIEKGPAILRSCTKPHVLYSVFKPSSKWAWCTCPQANRGYICKKKVKVLRMLRSDVEKGSIAGLC